MPIFPQARLLLVIWLGRDIHSSWYSDTTCNALHSCPSRSSRTLHSCTWCHAQSKVWYRTDFASWFAKFLRWNLLLNSVLFNAHWRSSPLMKNLERQWWNGWCLARCYAIPVASQAPFSLCKSLSRDNYMFQMPPWSIKAFPGCRTWGEKEQSFSSTFGEESLPLDGLLRDIDSHNHAINPIRLEKK